MVLSNHLEPVLDQGLGVLSSVQLTFLKILDLMGLMLIFFFSERPGVSCILISVTIWNGWPLMPHMCVLKAYSPHPIHTNTVFLNLLVPVHFLSPC